MQRLRHAVPRDNSVRQTFPPPQNIEFRIENPSPCLMGTNSTIRHCSREMNGSRRRRIIQDAISVRAVSIKIHAIRHDIRKRPENFPRTRHDLSFAKTVVPTAAKKASAGSVEKRDGGRKGRRAHPTNRK